MEKQYFIKDLETVLGVKRKTFFYWEKTGKVPKSRRTPMGNYRYWTEDEIKHLKKLVQGR